MLPEENKESQELSIKKLPYNIEAEQVLLGGLLQNNEYINKVADFLLAEHFYEPIHQRIFEAITNLYDKGIIANPVTLKNRFEQDEALKELGGVNYLLRISSKAMGLVDMKNYGKIVYNSYISRKLIEISEETIDFCYNSTGHETPSEQIEIPESKLFNLASAGGIESSHSAVSDVVKSAIKNAEIALKNDGMIRGVKSGFRDLDKVIGGFKNSDLLILAARPSMGKTALAINFAVNAAKNLKDEYEKKLQEYEEGNSDEIDKPAMGSVALFSLEMSSEQLVTRVLSIKSGIDTSHITQGRFKKTSTKDEFDELLKSGADISQLPILLDDTPAISISALRTRARRMKRKHNLSMIIVDYLQLMQGTSRRANENRVQEISEISMGLKAIAKELNIPVIALSQLSRQVEQRGKEAGSKRPQLSDLRESGSIEQDADIVMFIYREAYYKEREEPSHSDIEKWNKWQEEFDAIKNVSEIMVAKNRNGPIGNVRMFFNQSTTEFADLDEHH
jgi:replicative DNA helicase